MVTFYYQLFYLFYIPQPFIRYTQTFPTLNIYIYLTVKPVYMQVIIFKSGENNDDLVVVGTVPIETHHILYCCFVTTFGCYSSRIERLPSPFHTKIVKKSFSVIVLVLFDKCEVKKCVRDAIPDSINVANWIKRRPRTQSNSFDEFVFGNCHVCYGVSFDRFSFFRRQFRISVNHLG